MFCNRSLLPYAIFACQDLAAFTVAEAFRRICDQLSIICFDCRTNDRVLRTLSFALRYTLGYLLMLVVGTFDVMLFLSIVVGAGIGYFLSDPLCTWYSSINYRDSENEYQRNENNDYRPIHRLTHSV